MIPRSGGSRRAVRRAAAVAGPLRSDARRGLRRARRLSGRHGAHRAERHGDALRLRAEARRPREPDVHAGAQPLHPARHRQRRAARGHAGPRLLPPHATEHDARARRGAVEARQARVRAVQPRRPDPRRLTLLTPRHPSAAQEFALTTRSGVGARADLPPSPVMPRALLQTVVLAVLALLATAAAAIAQTPAGEYAHCERTGDALLLDVSGATCDEARALAMALTGVPAANLEPALATAGWVPLRAAATGFQSSYDLVATRGLASLLIRRPGEAPDLDGWMAGRELIFSRAQLIPGA